MLGIRKGEGFKKVQMMAASNRIGARARARAQAQAAANSTTTITTASGQVLTISEFISQIDEAARRRLDSMNEKLRGLEMQMEAFEAEISRANDTTASLNHWS